VAQSLRGESSDIAAADELFDVIPDAGFAPDLHAHTLLLETHAHDSTALDQEPACAEL